MSSPKNTFTLLLTFFLLPFSLVLSDNHGAPFCTPTGPGVCNLGWLNYNLYNDNPRPGHTAEAWLYDRNCNQLGYSDQIPTESGDYAFDSQLPYAVIIHAHNDDVPAFDYAGKSYSQDKWWCYGIKDSKPGMTACQRAFAY